MTTLGSFVDTSSSLRSKSIRTFTDIADDRKNESNSTVVESLSAKHKMLFWWFVK